MNCMATLFWSLIALVSMTLMFSVCLTQLAVASYLPYHHTEVEPPAHVTKSRHYFSGIGMSMYVLFQSIANGLSWGTVCTDLMKSDASAGVFFLIYIFVMVFGIVNVVTSVFV